MHQSENFFRKGCKILSSGGEIIFQLDESLKGKVIEGLENNKFVFEEM
jgi:hypothetical protein